MHVYEGLIARTVPIDKAKVRSNVGEITVNVMRRARPKQFSINPMYLEPWPPVIGGEVIVTSGTMIGCIGILKEIRLPQYVVSFSVDNDSRDIVLDEMDIAALEDIKQ